jgi:hypothetical protein
MAEYKIEDKEYNNKICEPLVPYEASAVSIDPAKLYTYADYLTWTDNIRHIKLWK